MQDLVGFRSFGGHSPGKRRYVCPGRSTPLDFSARGSTNVLFHRFRFVQSIDTWKTMCGTLWHILASGIPAAGYFSLQVQESSKCYRPNVRKGTPGSYALHHLVNNTFDHTSTHILGPHGRFGWIPVLRRSSPPGKRRYLCPGGSTPLDFSAYEI